ncbi:MAG: AI-2E family transporter [Acidimicrobiales bacterium]
MSDQAPSVPRWLAGAAAVSWRVVVAVAALVLLGMAFRRLEVIVVPVVGALFITTVLGPPAAWLRRHGVPRLLATWVVLLAAAGVVAGVIFGILPGFEHELPKLSNSLAQGITKVQGWLVSGPLHLSRAQVSTSFGRVTKLLTNHQQTLIQGAISGVSLLASVLVGVLLTIVLTFFFVKDGSVMGDWAMGLFSERRARDVQAIGQRSWAVITGYIRGTAANGFVNGVVLSLTMVGLGLPFAFPVGLVTFVGGFLPLVGGILSGLVAALVALVAQGPVAAGIMVGATILVHNLEGYLVGPLVLGKAVKLHPVAVLLILGLGTIIGGAIGAFLAVPVAAVVLKVIDYYRSGRGALVLPAERPSEGPRPLAVPDQPAGAGAGAGADANGHAGEAAPGELVAQIDG